MVFKFVVTLFLSGFLLTGTDVHSQEIEKVKAVDLERIISESKTPLIINFWATWCVPCVEELPHFLEEAKDHKKDSVRLILVSLDFADAYPDKIIKFVKRKKINVPVMWLDETNADYFCPKVDPKWSGVIPATLFINNAIAYRNFTEGQLSHKELKGEIKMLLGKD